MKRKKKDKRQLKAIERTLMDLAKRFRRDLGDSLRRVQNVSLDHPTDLLDMASDSEIDCMSALSAQAGSATIDEIERALTKLKQGTYGVCEDCGQAIAARRLKARPFAVLCIDCKTHQEGGGNDQLPDTLSARPDADFGINLYEEDVGARDASFDQVFRDMEDVELSELF
jgi:DnaK suppressor protein